MTTRAIKQGLAALWRALGRLDARLRRAEALEARVAQLERLGAPDDRLPAVEAARRLCISPRTARRWIESGKLAGFTLPSGGRRLWVALLSGVERLEAEGAAPAAPATENQAAAGRRTRRKGG